MIKIIIKTNLRTFKGSISIITGGASGIGRALAIELAKRGSEVILADIQTDLANEVASLIKDNGGTAWAAHIDVSDQPGVESLLKETVKRTGRIDFMFNNAGIGIAGPINYHTNDDWNRIIDVNLKGVVNGTNAAYKIMAEQGFGHIVNTASMAGLVPIPLLISYSATKHGVVGLSKSLRAESSDSGIRVSLLCPGVINTPILEDGGKFGKISANLSPEQKDLILKKFKPMKPDVFAFKAINAVARNKAIIIIPSWWKILWWMDRFSPSLGMLIAKKYFLKAKKEGFLSSLQ